MRIFSRTDGLGALTAGKDVTLLVNDTADAIKFNVTTNTAASVSLVGADLVISLGLDGVASIRVADDGAQSLPAGGKLRIVKTTAVGLYTPQIEIEHSDPVQIREAASNANVIIAREMSYWSNVMLLCGLGLSTVAGVNASATVDISQGSIAKISSSSGTLNIIG